MSGGVPILLATLRTTTGDDVDDCGASKVRANCSVPRSSVRNILDATRARLCGVKSVHASADCELSRLSDVFTTACTRHTHGDTTTTLHGGPKSYAVFLSASLYFSKRGAYWDRLCRDVVGRWLVVTRVHCGQTVHPRPIVTMEH